MQFSTCCSDSVDNGEKSFSVNYRFIHSVILTDDSQVSDRWTGQMTADGTDEIFTVPRAQTRAPVFTTFVAKIIYTQLPSANENNDGRNRIE